MRIVARHLLWILIAGLPMQGSAAAFMALSAGQAVSIEPMQADHCDNADKDAGNVDSKCGSCASCCIGACAAPVDYLNPDAHPQPNDSLVSPEPAMTTFIAATLERPPRRCA
jgi:hypothetical protein